MILQQLLWPRTEKNTLLKTSRCRCLFTSTAITDVFHSNLKILIPSEGIHVNAKDNLHTYKSEQRSSRSTTEVSRLPYTSLITISPQPTTISTTCSPKNTRLLLLSAYRKQALKTILTHLGRQFRVAFESSHIKITFSPYSEYLFH